VQAATPQPPLSSSNPISTPPLRKRHYALGTGNTVLTVIGIVVGAGLAWFAITIALKANQLSLEALALADWTAMKDFREVCKSRMVWYLLGKIRL